MKLRRRSFLAALVAGATALGLPGTRVPEAQAGEYLLPYKEPTWTGSACAGCEICTIPTFEAMQDDCAARGHAMTVTRITYGDGRRWAALKHGDHEATWHLDYAGGEPYILSRVDAWRQALHESGT